LLASSASASAGSAAAVAARITRREETVNFMLLMMLMMVCEEGSLVEKGNAGAGMSRGLILKPPHVLLHVVGPC
jgi:hypothetical protein